MSSGKGVSGLLGGVDAAVATESDSSSDFPDDDEGEMAVALAAWGKISGAL